MADHFTALPFIWHSQGRPWRTYDPHDLLWRGDVLRRRAPFSAFAPRISGAPNPTSSAIGSGISTAGAIAAVAAGIPIVGPIAAGVGLIFSALGIGGGCGQTCTQASQAVQVWAPQVTQLGQLWQQTMQSQGGCITLAQQQQFLAAFDALWNWLVQQCGAIGGEGGQKCIADRNRGGKADVFAQWRDPISNTPLCDAASSVSAASPAVLNTGNSTNLLPLLILGLIAAGIAVS